jgi:hypothetical protein
MLRRFCGENLHFRFQTVSGTSIVAELFAARLNAAKPQLAKPQLLNA